MGRLKLFIKILLGREDYIPTQTHCPTEIMGVAGGQFPVARSVREGGACPLTVYSFGVGEDLSFSEAILGAYPGAEVFAFDPTPKAIAYVKKHALSQNSRFHFYPYGISDENGMETFYLPKNTNYVSGSVVGYDGVDPEQALDVEMKTLDTIMRELGHDCIDILKMDIEGSEFKVVPYILNAGCRFTQLCIEVHQRFFPDRKEKLRGLLQALNAGGYFTARVLDSGEELLFIKKDA